MDNLDKKILSLLEENARMPVKEIAARVALTSPAVSSRIRRMEKQGVIGGYTVVRGDQTGEGVQALVSVSVPPAARPDFITAARAERRVTQCHHVTGSHSYLVKAACEDMQALEALITTFQRFGATSTQIILSTPVDRPAPARESLQ